MLIAIDCDECEGSFIFLYTSLLQFYDGFAAKVNEGEREEWEDIKDVGRSKLYA